MKILVLIKSLILNLGFIIISLFLLSSCSFQNDIIDKAETINSSPKTILALGDSLTAGYSLDIKDSYPSQLQELLQEKGYNYEVLNAGVSGNTSSQLLDRIDVYLDDDSIEAAIIVIGGNDGLRGYSVSDLESNLNKIIEKLKSKNIKIIIGGMQVPLNLGPKYSYDFKRIYKKVADKNDAYLIDFFLDGVAGKSDLNLSDNIHPNKQGYKIISDNIFEFLEDNDIIIR